MIKNSRRQLGGTSWFILALIVGGISFGAYAAKNNGLISVNSNSTIASISTSVTRLFSSYTSDSDYSGYGIQLMATRQLGQAKSLMKDFAQDGYSAFVLSSKAKGRTIYKVRLGPYSHKPEAVAIKDKVIRRYPNNPFVKTSLVIYKPN